MPEKKNGRAFVDGMVDCINHISYAIEDCPDTAIKEALLGVRRACVDALDREADGNE